MDPIYICFKRMTTFHTLKIHLLKRYYDNLFGLKLRTYTQSFAHNIYIIIYKRIKILKSYDFLLTQYSIAHCNVKMCK
jgi:hypothetical protein